jgi:hypothetical protein
MRQSLAFVLYMLPVLALGQFSQFHSQHPTPAPTLIKAGRILDVTSGKYLDDQAILTDGERIKVIGPLDQVEAHAPKDVIQIDLSQATVLPGLIDCHAHPFVSMDPHMSGGEGLTTAIALMSPTLRVFIGAHNLMEDLEARPCASWAIRASTGTSHFATQSTWAWFRGQGCRLPAGSSLRSEASLCTYSQLWRNQS